MNEWNIPPIEENAERDLAEARSIIQKMQRLFEDNDYKFLHTMMQSSLDAKVLSMLTAPNGMDGVVAGIYNNGKISGFQEAMNFASILHAGAMGTVDQLSYLDQKGQENGTRE